MKKLGKILFFFLFIGFLSFLALERTKGFSLQAIYTERTPDAIWQIPQESICESELKTILAQPYYFIGAGRQCFAFVSEDQNYVLKFINQAKFTLPSFLLKIPFPYFLEKRKKQKQARKKARIAAFYDSFKLAYDHLKEETGLIYLHLYPQLTFEKPLYLINPIGYPMKVDLNQTHFLVQKRASLIYPYLEKYRANDKAFEEGMKSYLDLVLQRIEKGFCDDDLNIDQNIGFVGKKAILLDFGRVYPQLELRREKEVRKEVQRSTKFFRRWLQKNHPEKLSLLEQICEKKIDLYVKQHKPLQGN